MMPLAWSRPWLLLFGTRDCTECAALKEYWEEEYADAESPVLVFLDIESADNYRFLNKIEEELGIENKASSFPVLLAGRRFINGRSSFDEVEDSLSELLASSPSGGGVQRRGKGCCGGG